MEGGMALSSVRNGCRGLIVTMLAVMLVGVLLAR